MKIMTLDEAIAKAERLSESCDHGSVVLEERNMPMTAKKYKANAEEQRQIAGWLKELKELRGASNE